MAKIMLLNYKCLSRILDNYPLYKICSILHKQSDIDHFRTNLSSEKIEKYESRKINYIPYCSFDKYDQSQFKLWRKLEWKKLAMVAEQFWVTFGKLLRRSSYRYEDTLS